MNKEALLRLTVMNIEFLDVFAFANIFFWVVLAILLKLDWWRQSRCAKVLKTSFLIIFALWICFVVVRAWQMHRI